MTLRLDSPGSPGSHGRSRPDACSVLWDDARASTLGTAPAAVFWMALEQNGPWGARAASQSHLDPALGDTLDRMCQEAGGRLILIRRPGTHADPPETRPGRHSGRRSDLPDLPDLPDRADARPKRLYLAGGLASRPWLLQADLDDPARLALLPWAALAGDDPDAVQAILPELEPSPAPVLMICSNSRRDVCCAVRGRPVALESAAQRPGRVWECSHTGGHRFAPTGVLLPYGQTFGRLSGTSAIAAIDAATRGEVPAELMGATYDRGRSHLSAAGQAAESVVRQQIQEPSLLALSTTAVPGPDPDQDQGTWQCRVSHIDGRQWNVLAVRHTTGNHLTDLPESCGKAPVPRWNWDCTVEMQF